MIDLFLCVPLNSLDKTKRNETNQNESKQNKRRGLLIKLTTDCTNCILFHSILFHSILSSLNQDTGSSRRNLLKKGVAFAAGVAAPIAANAYSVPDLLYPFEGLEPYIDAPTMKIHHDKHHATYVGNINKATEGKDEVPILDLMADALDATPVRNSGGGHYNHGKFV